MIGKIKKNKKKYSLILAGFVVLIFSGIVFAHNYPGPTPNTWNTGYRLNGGTALFGIRYGNSAGSDAGGDCTVVKNSGSSDFFVPTKRSGEFSAFTSHMPSNVSSCCTRSSCVRGTSGSVGINCPNVSGCCRATMTMSGYTVPNNSNTVIVSGSLISNASNTGIWDRIRRGGGDWSSCVILGTQGANIDCECRRDKDGLLWCGDYTATVTKSVCRVN